MKFSKEFKELINKIFKESDADCIQITLEEEENHDVSINLGLLSTKEIEGGYKVMDDINVLIDDETLDALEGAVFSAKDDEVVIELEHCGCGCHDHEHGEEHDDCCCHHHHHHNGECCEGDNDDDCCCKKED